MTGALSELHIFEAERLLFAAGRVRLLAPGAFDASSTCFSYEAYSVRFRMSKSVCIKGLFFVFDAIGALAMCINCRRASGVSVSVVLR